ncbi:MAG TPA: hypothetical protein ENO21_01920 [Firmicutes bacterium]|nr:hypothetical protein [Bacillota bacterium]
MGVWLAAAAVMFLAALAPAQSAPEQPVAKDVIIRLVPERPLPGDIVQVRIGVQAPSSAPRMPGMHRHKSIAVDHGVLTAVRRHGDNAGALRIAGRELEGELSCVSWKLPDYPVEAQIVVRVDGRLARASVHTGWEPWEQRLAAQFGLAPVVNLWRGAGVR